MKIERLYLRNFRNVKELELLFSPGLNCIIAKNGMGKTSILEALYLFVAATSFRTNCLQELIAHDTPGFFAEILFEKEGIRHQVSLAFDGKKRRVVLNGAVSEATSILIGLLHIVAMTPDDIEIVSGAPAQRRRYLDVHIAQRDPVYVHHLARYGRALKTRNHLLKLKRFETIRAWEKEMAVSACYIASARTAACSELGSQSRSSLERLAGIDPDDFRLELKTQLPQAASQHDAISFLIGEYEKRRPQEAKLAATLTGPHRDDIEILFCQKRAREYASIGQKRLIATSLKLAEWSCLKTSSQANPILLIDDFGTSLDGERQDSILHEIGSLGQVFLTAHKEIVLPAAQNVELIRLHKGARETL